MNLLRRFLYVIFFVQVGLLLIVLPWWPAFWEHNYFALAYPPLRSLLTNNFVRGAVSGLGFVNLFAGFADLALLFTTRDQTEMSLDDSPRRS
ncbi:MAG TPA: hypothetical protein VKE51_08155 [Vicinamibacterales bacterium]|nr:hypothetical protein [Vicinamibacterales bacterium]